MMSISVEKSVTERQEMDIDPPLNDSLMSFEKLDRASPDIWPEQIPGVTEYVSTHIPSSGSTIPIWLKPLTVDDVELMHKLATHSTSGLITEVKNLHDLAYQLGMEEAREMTRGKYLQIFTSRKNR